MRIQPSKGTEAGRKWWPSKGRLCLGGAEVPDLFWLKLEESLEEGDSAARSPSSRGQSNRAFARGARPAGGPCLPAARPGCPAGHTPWATEGVSRPHGDYVPACRAGDARTLPQKDLCAKTHKGKGGESSILLSNMWVVLHTISNKIFLM